MSEVGTDRGHRGDGRGADAHERYVVVGYSAAMVEELDERLPADSVVLVEEPHVLAARGALDLAERSTCVERVVAAPTQAADLNQIRRLGRPDGTVCVMPAVEYSVVAAAALAEAWGLPGAGVGAATVLRDKLLLRDAAHAAGLDQPAWHEVTSAQDVERFLAAAGERCVLKPANRQASLGVQVLAPGDDVARAWDHTVAADEPRLRAPGGFAARFMVERWVRGQELSVELLRRSGKSLFANVTAKSVAAGRFPVETGHVVPAPGPVALREGLVRATERLAAALGFDTGVLHAEWIVADGRPHLVECAGRLPGDSIDGLVRRAWGVDLLTSLVDTLSGRPVTFPSAPRLAAAVRFLDTPAGTVTEVLGIDEARRAAGVDELEVTASPGDVRGAVRSSWERAGYVITVGGTPEEAAVRAVRATELVSIRTDGALA